MQITIDSRARALAAALVALLAPCGCGDGDAAAPDAGPSCDLSLDFERGDDGHPDPLGAGPGEARAGRLRADQLPPSPTGLAMWSPGDFVLANDRVALVIEDVGPSDGYDPWGGRPVGAARVAGGALVDPMEFGEFFVLTNRDAVVTQSVSVVADGSDGGPAVVRVDGFLSPLPFFEWIVGGLFRDTYPDVRTAIEYVLEPDSDTVDIYVVHRSPRQVPAEVHTILHGFMYAARTPAFSPGVGFDTDGEPADYLAFIDDDATSFAYWRADGALRPGVSQSGFTSKFSAGFTIEPCAETRRHHARVTIGGPGVDGIVAAMARATGAAVRELSGTVREADGAPAAGVRVHAESAAGDYLTRARTGADGRYTLHVPVDAAVQLTAYRRGDEVVGPVAVAAGEPGPDLTLAPAGWVHVEAVDADTGEALPARIQLLPVDRDVPSVPARFGEPMPGPGRLHVEFPIDGVAVLRAPVGAWDVVVSRGYEYEIVRQRVTVDAGATVEVTAPLAHVVDTTGVMCADFHIHTHRSADSGDDARMKVRSAIADGLELPVRSDHEYAQGFQPEIEDLGVERWAYGVPSVELTTMEFYGHFGVLPAMPDPTDVNGGAPRWQRYPTAEAPDTPFESLMPKELFAQVRARPEAPVIIINHPRGGANYFDFVDYDPTTGMVGFPEFWDEEFVLVEVFNDASWTQRLDREVRDWLGLLDSGRRVFAVGSSDSHGVSRSPVGYPRTCLRLGTDDPRELDWEIVRDTTAAGAATISGGIYVDAAVGSVGPGGDADGLGERADVHVRVQAASWVDVDAVDVVVDGAIVATLPIAPADADPDNPAVRFERDVSVDVAPGGSYVIVAAYGDAPLEPVHPGRLPFGVTNPIFLHR
ncbi:MAG: carboxypeptidase regulatory-like domain-containing protein [Deltaproteobacteria bacterium]|nr:MAG: carboxypeptidase regulatory-like domain-containing protein [Deltaproteobacteria bacterium]